MKYFLLKSLLAIAVLCAGSVSVWAETGDKVTNLNVEFNGTWTAGAPGSYSAGTGEIFQSSSVWAWKAKDTAADNRLVDGHLMLPNGNFTLEFANAEIGSKDVVEISFDIAFGGRCGAYPDQYIKLLDGAGNVIVQEIYNYNGNGITSSTMDRTVSKSDLGVPESWGSTSWSDKVHFDYTFDYAKYELTCVITKKDGVSTIKKTITIPSGVGYVNKFFVQSNDSKASDRGLFIDNITATTIEGDYSSPTVEYTINYKQDDKVVKTVEGSNYIGTTIFATNVLDGEGDYAGNHYLITAAEAPSMELVEDAASNVLNVPVRAPYTATLRVTTTIGGTPSVVDTPLTETDGKVCGWSFAYSKYVVKDGVYYLCDDDGFAQSGTFTDGETVTKNITYSTADESIVRYYEGEASAGSNASYSYGGYGTVAAQNARNRGISAGTLTPGVYQFEGKLVSDGNSGRAITIREGTNDPMASLVGNNTTRTVTANFTVSSATGALYINGANSGEVKTNLSTSFDYVLIRKTAEVGTIPLSGIGSLASAYGLNFADATVSEGVLTAYVVTEITADRAKVSSVDEMPANSGVILEGTAGATYTIPVKADAIFDGTNNLQAAVTATPIAANEAYILKNGQFHKVTAASTVPAGKAYLLAKDVPAGVKALRFDFDGLATGINGLANGQQPMANGPIFNLAGQRVNKAVKGLYIVNGKKIVK